MHAGPPISKIQSMQAPQGVNLSRSATTRTWEQDVPPPATREDNALVSAWLAVHPAYRTSLATIGLCRWMYEIALEQCVTHVYAILEGPLLRNLQLLGFPFTAQGTPQQLMGGVVHPTVCVVSEVVQALGQTDSDREGPQLSALFDAPFTGVLASADIGIPVQRRASPVPLAST
jgi:hypothetical protein